MSFDASLLGWVGAHRVAPLNWLGGLLGSLAGKRRLAVIALIGTVILLALRKFRVLITAGIAAAVAEGLGLVLKMWFGAAVVIACLIGAMTVYVGAHWPTDVLVGLPLGFAVALGTAWVGAKIRPETAWPSSERAAGSIPRATEPIPPEDHRDR